MRQEIESTDDIVEKLKKSFAALTFQEKKDVVDCGRPTPLLNISKQSKTCLRKFNPEIYNKVYWICGSTSSNKLYCWPCLLFSQDDSIWSSPHRGYSDLNNLHTAVGRHEKTASHLSAFVTFKTFGQTRIDALLSQQRNAVINQHNAEVKRNREVLKRLIRITCFLGIQEIAFRGHDESQTSNNRGNYIEMAYLIAEFDDKLQTHLSSATVFRGLSPTIQNDLIDSVSHVVLAEIKKELHNCLFVSVLLDETSDISCYSQLSTVFRYVNTDGHLHERFVKFSDVSKDRSAVAIARLVVAQLIELGCLKKLVAQSYDGAAVMSGELNGVQAKVKESAPDAIFIHCFAHRLNLVLIQATSRICKCKIFFSTLGGLSSFFTSSSKRTAVLDDMVKRRFPKLAPTRWNYSSRLVETVRDNQEELIQLFEHVTESQNFDQKSINEALGFLLALSSFDFNFLLLIFAVIFPFTEYLFNIFQSKFMDILFCSGEVQNTLTKLEELRANKFNETWNVTVNKCGQPACRKSRDSLQPEMHYKALFLEIIDTIIMQMKTRFRSVKDIEFVELLDGKRFQHYNNSDRFSERPLQALQKSYSSHFNFSFLRSELTVLYSHDHFRKNNLEDLHKYMHERQLYEAFGEVHKLVLLVLTIPYSTASVERSFSALKRIKTFLRNAPSQDRLSNLSLMSIEKSLLKQLMSKPEVFYDAVTDHFCRKRRRAELLYQ